MSFTVRAFYDDGNIVVDVPLNMSHLSQECLGGFSEPGPEFLMPITSVAGHPMINAHGPFYRRLVEAGMGQFQFRLKSYPWIRDDVELTCNNRNYIIFGAGWQEFVEAYEIHPND
ncbi:hypothetical protein ACLB2K_045837 [Fragaria x ananassa]